MRVNSTIKYQINRSFRQDHRQLTNFVTIQIPQPFFYSFRFSRRLTTSTPNSHVLSNFTDVRVQACRPERMDVWSPFCMCPPFIPWHHDFWHRPSPVWHCLRLVSRSILPTLAIFKFITFHGVWSESQLFSCTGSTLCNPIGADLETLIVRFKVRKDMGAFIHVVWRVFGLLVACYYSHRCSYRKSSYRDEVEFDRRLFENDKDEVSLRSEIELSLWALTTTPLLPLLSFFRVANPSLSWSQIRRNLTSSA